MLLYIHKVVAFTSTQEQLREVAAALDKAGYNKEDSEFYNQLEPETKSIVVYGAWKEYGFYSEGRGKISAEIHAQTVEEMLKLTCGVW
jgi:hypothetical protein